MQNSNQIKWQPLSADELSAVSGLTGLDGTLKQMEFSFILDVVDKLESYGELGANFTIKQRSWIKRLAIKYL